MCEDGIFRRLSNSRRISRSLESYFDAHATDVWGSNWGNPEVQTAFLNTYPPTLIATVLKALREQLKENDQLNPVEEIARPVPIILIEYEHILRDGGGGLGEMMSTEDMGSIMFCWLPNATRLHGYTLAVSAKLFP